MKLPERYNYAEAYLTFRCNLSCGYCINKIQGLTRREELSADEWIENLNNIDFGDTPLTLGGGEPTRHKEFYKIVSGLNHNLDLLTNLQFNVNEFIKNVDQNKFTKSNNHYHSIRASYHASQMNREKTIENAVKLIDAGFNIGIFGVRHPYVLNENMEMAFLCSKNKIPFYEKDFLGEVDGRIYGFYKYPEGLDGKKKDVKCRTREFLIAPDGNIHRCHRDLYAGENPVGNIKTIDHIKDIFRKCSVFGECNPCDLKLKTNKYLKGIECQVEIK